MADLARRPTVVLADDDRSLLDRVRQLLNCEFEVVGTVEDGHALLTAASDLHPDLFVTDISMPRLNGFQAARQLMKEQPSSRIVFLTVHDAPVIVTEALSIGVSGYVLKRSAASELIPALRQVLDGGQFISKGIQE